MKLRTAIAAALDEKVLVLNRLYTAVRVISARRAFVMLCKRAAEVICHELAHMWYGDLVTMAWWDDLWLNEAFATWMAFEIVDDWKPEWKMWHDFQHGRAAALEADALRNTHPVYCPVRTAAEANENFDLITYEKGAAVVRMLERYLGTPAFRRGVRRYIRRHREGNTVASDLWRALSEASGEEVEPLARAWIDRAGHPVVTLRRSRERGRALRHMLYICLSSLASDVEPGSAGSIRFVHVLWPLVNLLHAADHGNADHHSTGGDGIDIVSIDHR